MNNEDSQVEEKVRVKNKKEMFSFSMDKEDIVKIQELAKSKNMYVSELARHIMKSWLEQNGI